MKSFVVKREQELTTNSRNPDAIHFGYGPEFRISSIASLKKRDAPGFSRIKCESEYHSHRLIGCGDWHRKPEYVYGREGRFPEHTEFDKERFLG